MSKVKKMIGVFSIVGLLMASANVYAATATAEKPVNSTSTVESVSINGTFAYATFKTEVTGGTGSGQGKLYEFRFLWPDKKLWTHDVYYNGNESETTSYYLDGNEAYNVTAWPIF